jgi:predicted metal-dependent hydrolase
VNPAIDPASTATATAWPVSRSKEEEPRAEHRTNTTAVTAAGRMVGAVTMVVGISTFAIVTAKIAEFLVRKDGETTVSPVRCRQPITGGRRWT